MDLAYYTAERSYVRMYELPAGEGYADMVLYPKLGKAMPLMVIELKKDKTANTSLDQIRKRKYPDRFKDYGGRQMLPIAISYDADKLEKEHYCKIEKVQLPVVLTTDREHAKYSNRPNKDKTLWYSTDG